MPQDLQKLHQSRARAAAAAERIRLFAQPQRLMVLSCLTEGERSVSEIEAMTAIGQPALSQQLAELRRGELVAARRAGAQVYYRLASAEVALCVNGVEAMFGT